MTEDGLGEKVDLSVCLGLWGWADETLLKARVGKV